MFLDKSMGVFQHFTRRFLEVLEGAPSLIDFPKPELEPPPPITNRQFEEERNVCYRNNR